MLWTIVQLVVSLATILVAVVFTNAVGILGERLSLGGGAVGGALATVKTAPTEAAKPRLGHDVEGPSGGEGG